MKKRLVALVAACAAAALAVTGCGKLDSSDVVAEVGDAKITADVANFYARYQQAQYETNYAGFLGNDMWSGEASEGKTYEESVKESILDNLEALYVLDMHKKDYDVSLSEDEEKAIDKAVKKFSEANSLEDKEAVSGDDKAVKKVLTLLTIQEKMRAAVTADVDTEVSDDEAAQKKMQYVYFSFTKTDENDNSSQMTDDEKKELKAKAEEFQKGAVGAEDFKAYAEGLGYTVSDLTFDGESTSPSALLVQAADALNEGEVTAVVEDSAGYFVAKVNSLFDQEATDKKKVTIVSERKQKAFSDQIEKWLDKEKVTVHKSVWKKIDFVKQGVTIKNSAAEENK